MQYFQKLINKDLGFGYTLRDPIPSHDRADLWTLHHGTSKETKEPALVFVFEPSKARSQSGFGGPTKQELAKCGLQRLKTLRHPDVLKYASSVEGSDGTIYIATETATPLATLMSSGKALDREAVQWGLFTIARALGFLHQSGLIHGRLNAASVFVTPSGDWKLGGLEGVTQHTAASSLSRIASLQPEAYRSPEFSHNNWSAIASAAPHAVDSWALGCLMYEAHAGSLSSPDQLRNTQVLPKQLLSAYQKLLSSAPGSRAPAGEVPNHPYFKNSKFVELNMFVENLALKGQLEREAFLSKLPSLMDRLPDGFCTFKVLPMLSQSIETGAGGSAAFSCVVKMQNRLSEQQFANDVARKYAVRWYSSTTLDRTLRVELYAKMDLFVTHFDAGTINNAIFPAMCGGFQDMQAPALRDASVKAVLGIATKLTEKNLNSTLMSHFARLQVDTEPAIRTNTTVCLGKLASKLNQSARSKVLIPAFLRALKDPFPPARAAGVNAIMITCDMYSVNDIATRVLPAIAPLLVDNATDVRSIAFKVMDSFVIKLTKNHEAMSACSAQETATGQANGGGNAARSSSGGGSSGWGLSSFTSMTAALLNKSDTSGQGTSKPPPSSSSSSSSATGISSDQFKKTSSTSGVGSDTWAAPQKTQARMTTAVSNGSAGPPPSFSSTPLTANPAPSSTFGLETGGETNSNFFGNAPEEEGADEDEDGWGDMDIKTSNETKATEEDLFVSMMGPTTGRSTTAGRPPHAGRPHSQTASSGGDKAETGDLWNFAPPVVAKPRPKPRQAANTLAGDFSRGMNLAANSRKKNSGADDWEALLGGAGSQTKRKPFTRSSGSR